MDQATASAETADPELRARARRHSMVAAGILGRALPTDDDDDDDEQDGDVGDGLGRGRAGGEEAGHGASTGADGGGSRPRTPPPVRGGAIGLPRVPSGGGRSRSPRAPALTPLRIGSGSALPLAGPVPAPVRGGGLQRTASASRMGTAGRGARSASPAGGLGRGRGRATPRLGAGGRLGGGGRGAKGSSEEEGTHTGHTPRLEGSDSDAEREPPATSRTGSTGSKDGSTGDEPTDLLQSAFFDGGAEEEERWVPRRQRGGLCSACSCACCGACTFTCDVCIAVACIGLFLLYPTLLRQVVSMLSCTEAGSTSFAPSDNPLVTWIATFRGATNATLPTTLVPEARTYLRVDMAVRCSGGFYEVFRPVAQVFAGLYIVGIPLLFLVLMTSYRKWLHLGRGQVRIGGITYRELAQRLRDMSTWLATDPSALHYFGGQHGNVATRLTRVWDLLYHPDEVDVVALVAKAQANRNREDAGGETSSTPRGDGKVGVGGASPRSTARDFESLPGPSYGSFTAGSSAGGSGTGFRLPPTPTAAAVGVAPGTPRSTVGGAAPAVPTRWGRSSVASPPPPVSEARDRRAMLQGMGSSGRSLPISVGSGSWAAGSGGGGGDGGGGGSSGAPPNLIAEALGSGGVGSGHGGGGVATGGAARAGPPRLLESMKSMSFRLHPSLPEDYLSASLAIQDNLAKARLLEAAHEEAMAISEEHAGLLFLSPNLDDVDAQFDCGRRKTWLPSLQQSLRRCCPALHAGEASRQRASGSARERFRDYLEARLQRRVDFQSDLHRLQAQRAEEEEKRARAQELAALLRQALPASATDGPAAAGTGLPGGGEVPPGPARLQAGDSWMSGIGGVSYSRLPTLASLPSDANVADLQSPAVPARARPVGVPALALPAPPAGLSAPVVAAPSAPLRPAPQPSPPLHRSRPDTDELLALTLFLTAEKVMAVGRMQRRFGWLYVDYRPGAYAYEFWNTAKKAALVGAAVVLADRPGMLQCTVCILLLLLYLLNHQYTQPMIDIALTDTRITSTGLPANADEYARAKFSSGGGAGSGRGRGGEGGVGGGVRGSGTRQQVVAMEANPVSLGYIGPDQRRLMRYRALIALTHLDESDLLRAASLAPEASVAPAIPSQMGSGTKKAGVRWEMDLGTANSSGSGGGGSGGAGAAAGGGAGGVESGAVVTAGGVGGSGGPPGGRGGEGSDGEEAEMLRQLTPEDVILLNPTLQRPWHVACCSVRAQRLAGATTTCTCAAPWWSTRINAIPEVLTTSWLDRLALTAQTLSLILLFVFEAQETNQDERSNVAQSTTILSWVMLLNVVFTWTVVVTIAVDLWKEVRLLGVGLLSMAPVRQALASWCAGRGGAASGGGGGASLFSTRINTKVEGAATFTLHKRRETLRNQLIWAVDTVGVLPQVEA